MEITYGELSFGVNEKYSDELLVETSVDTAERGGAEKALSLEAEVKASSVELLDGEAEVSGKVNYRLLYLDRQKRLCGLDYFKDFKCRVKGDAILPGGKSAVTFRVPDAEARVKGEEVELSAVVDVALNYYGETQKRAVQAVTEAETLVEEMPAERTVVKERVVEIDKVADVGLGVKKIVLFSATALPCEIKDGTASGEVRGTILYVNDADEVAELTVSLPFAEASEAAEVSAAVKSARVILTDDEEGNAVEVEASLVLTETFYEPIAQSAVTAACGEKIVVEETCEEAKEVFFVAAKRFEETLTGAVPLEEAGSVAFVRPGCHAVAEVTVTDGKVKVEGVAAFRVIQLGEEYHSEQGELPFVYELPFAEAKEGMTAEVTMHIADAVGSARGKDAAVTAKVFLCVRLFETKRVAYLSEAKEGAAIPQSDAGISVYFAEKGENAWSIAKSMGVLPSALVKANPFLAEPIDEARKILVFRQK